MLGNKTAIECWNILKYVIESIIDQFVLLKKNKENRLERNTCQKKLLVNSRQTVWRVYRRTRKDEGYTNYKESLNVAINEIRQSNRNYEQKCACSITNCSNGYYAYIRSKQNVRDKVGLLEDSAGNIISKDFIMAEDLNAYFSSVFTREDISSLPVPDAKFH